MKKLLIMAGVIALTSTTQVFAKECPKAEGPCPIKEPPAIGVVAPCPQKIQRCPFDLEKFEKELKLTDEQKEKAQQLRDSAEEAIKPIRAQMQDKKKEAEEIFNMKLTLKERQEKLAPIHNEMFALNKQIRDIRIQNKKDFEALLTDKQLKKLEKIKAEHKSEFKARHHKRGCMKKMHRGPRPMVCPEQRPLPPVQPEEVEK